MTGRIAVLLLALCGTPALAGAPTVRVDVGRTTTIEAGGATAAYPIDQALVDVFVSADQIRITGRRSGTTKVIVVRGSTVDTYDLEVRANTTAAHTQSTAAGIASTVVSSSFNSETGRLVTGVDSATLRAGRTVRASVTDVTRIGDTQSDVRSSIGAASLDISSPTRRVTLFDQLVESSPLTLDGSRVRGAHYRDRALDFHAGLSSPLLYQSVFLPTRADGVVGGSYTSHLRRMAISPSMYWYPDDSAFGGASGLATGMRVTSATQGRFRMMAEAGYGGDLAGAADLGFAGSRHDVALSAVHRPSGYPSLGGVRPYGTSLDAHWTARVSSRVRFFAATNASRQELVASVQRTAASNVELKTAVGQHWAFTFGSNVSRFDNGVTTATSVTIPVGAAWETPQLGMTAVFRYQQNTDRNRGGAGGRVRAHAAYRRLTASGFLDYQRDAATVALVFRDSPELARLFAELGLQTRTPEDLARLLHEQDALVASGYLERAALILNPRRMQVGADAGWSTRGNATRVRFSLVADRVETTGGATDHYLQSLSLTRRLSAAMDVTASSSWWTYSGAGPSRSRWSYAAGATLRGNAFANFASWIRRDAIAGRVLEDTGASTAAAATPMPGVRVRLDDGREVVTSADGRFRFPRSGAGPRRVEALLPATAGARFTTPSVVVARQGEDAVFTIGHVAARLFGTISDDAGAPIAGVHVRAVCAGRERAALTNSDGRYTIDDDEGDCQVDIDAASLPAGYSGLEVTGRTVRLARGTPARADYIVAADRSVAGRVFSTTGPVTVRIVETGEERSSDQEGWFVFRHLKPGTYTLRTEIRGKRVDRVVVIPEGPALVNIALNNNNNND